MADSATRAGPREVVACRRHSAREVADTGLCSTAPTISSTDATPSSAVVSASGGRSPGGRPTATTTHGNEARRSTTPRSARESSAVVMTTTPSGSESVSAAKGEHTSAASSPSDVERTRMPRPYRRRWRPPLSPGGAPTGGRIERWIVGAWRGRRAAPWS